MKAAILLTLATAAVAFPKFHQLNGYSFERYLADSGKTYSEEEYPVRLALFQSRLEKIQAHNAGGHSWRMGVNQFTDMTDAERDSYHGFNYPLSVVNRVHDIGNYDRAASSALLKAPLAGDVNFSWIDRGYMGGVKNQGGCGSCWSFSAISALESHVAIGRGNRGVPTLSVQQFVDCVENPFECGGTGGCYGATAELAYEYSSKMSIRGEYEYPYVDFKGGKTDKNRCPTRSGGASSVITDGYVRVPANNQDATLAALERGPLVVAVFASLWKDYESGIFDGCSRVANNVINHGVVLTGAGDDGRGNSWWEIRNSWGPQWGEHGVMRLRRNARAAACYIDLDPLDGTECRLPGPVPANITVCGECGILWDPVFPVGARFK